MNSRVMLLLAGLLVLAAGTAGYLGYRTTQEAREEARKAKVEAEVARSAAVTTPGKVAVVVAQRAIPAYTKITAEDVSLDYVRLEPPYTYRKLEDLIGQVIQADVAAGELVNQEHLQPGSEIARLLRPGERGLAIAIDEVVGGGGFVQPGDTVDVLMFVSGENRPNASAQIVMRALRVVGMGSQVVGPDGLQAEAGKDDKENARTNRRRARTAVLAVTEEEVTRLMLASSVGTLRLAIRPSSEQLLACRQAADGTGCAPAQPGTTALTPGKTGPGNNRLLRAGALVAPAAVPSSRPAAPRRAPVAAAPARPAQPTITIFRGLNNTTTTP